MSRPRSTPRVIATKTKVKVKAKVKAKAKAAPKRMAAAKPTTIDAYLANVTGEQRKALDALRKQLRSLLPGAEECISYGLPAFRLDGAVVAGFAATAKGCSYYPFSGSTLKTLLSKLSGYTMTPGALHFETAKPLPRALLQLLLKTRRAEVKARATSS